MSPHRPTAAQARAADPKRSLWVTANAGTGKTRVLTDRVLRLLLDGAHPEGILCITFTRAAAVEMTGRIEEALASWAVETDDDRLSAQLQAVTGREPSRGLLAKARRLFAQVLDLPHGVPIQTIHSFCAALLRRFPIEAGIPPHFETIDDRTAGELMRESRNRLLGTLRQADPRLAEALDQLSAIMAETSLSGLLLEILGKRRSIEKALAGGLDDLILRIFRTLDAPAGMDPPELVRRACADGVMDVEGLRQAVEILLRGKKTDIKRGLAIATWLELTASDRVDAFESYNSQFITTKGTPALRLATKEVKEASPSSFDALLHEQARLVRLGDQIKAAKIAGRTAALAIVANALLEDYRTAKERSAALDFDDLIEQAEQLLSSPDRRDWVLYKLDARIEHILVDEAQDTSPSQWQVIMNLVEELAAGQGAHERPRTLFVVGDEKQSIYSFQGADLDNFRSVHRQLGERMELLDARLETSFRSSQAILDLVDAALDIPRVKEGVARGGTPARHATSRKNHVGEVRLWPLQEAPEQLDEQEPWALPDARPWRRTAEELLARNLAREIAECLASGEVMASTGMPLQPSDVLVLVSRRGRIQELLISALKKREVPVAGADRMGLTSHLAVRDLMALTQALLLPEDDLTLACLLKSPLVGLGEEDLFDLAHNRGTASLFESLRRKSEQYPRAWALIEDWLRRADFVPPYELLTSILAEGGRQRLLSRLGPEAAEPIEMFLGQALAYEEGHPATLQGFLHWLTMDESSLKRDPAPARDEVRVMTVHGAKGLEAPFVILADAGPHQVRERGRIIVDPTTNIPYWRGTAAERVPVIEQLCAQRAARQEQERSRLLYVALTRAKDRLLVAGWLGQRQTLDKESWHGDVRSALLSLDGHELIGKQEDGEPTLVYRRGTVTEAAPRDLDLPEPIPPLPDWTRRQIEKEPAPRPSLQPSKLLAADPPAASPLTDRDVARDFGISVHRLLHQLAGLPTAERSRYLARTEPVMAHEIERVLDHPELAPAFQPGSLAEQPIIGRIGDQTISGQIDRMVVEEDRVLIIDFKTARRPPSSPERIAASYLRQLAAYTVLLERIYPAKRIEAALVWTAVPELMPVPHGLLQRYRSEWFYDNEARA